MSQFAASGGLNVRPDPYALNRGLGSGLALAQFIASRQQQDWDNQFREQQQAENELYRQQQLDARAAAAAADQQQRDITNTLRQQQFDAQMQDRMARDLERSATQNYYASQYDELNPAPMGLTDSAMQGPTEMGDPLGATPQELLEIEETRRNFSSMDPAHQQRVIGNMRQQRQHEREREALIAAEEERRMKIIAYSQLAGTKYGPEVAEGFLLDNNISPLDHDYFGSDGLSGVSKTNLRLRAAELNRGDGSGPNTLLSDIAIEHAKAEASTARGILDNIGAFSDPQIMLDAQQRLEKANQMKAAAEIANLYESAGVPIPEDIAATAGIDLPRDTGNFDRPSSASDDPNFMQNQLNKLRGRIGAPAGTLGGPEIPQLELEQQQELDQQALQQQTMDLLGQYQTRQPQVQPGRSIPGIPGIEQQYGPMEGGLGISEAAGADALAYQQQQQIDWAIKKTKEQLIDEAWSQNPNATPQEIERIVRAKLAEMEKGRP